MLDRQMVLITGANGFLGTELTRQAIAAGLFVRATDRHDSSRTPGVDYCRADIRDTGALGAACRGVDAVIHAAGLAHIFKRSQARIAPFKAVNELGTAIVAQSAVQAGVQHLILVSSMAVYGRSTKRDESATCEPEGNYAESKLQAEWRALQVTEGTGTGLSILRMATLYGEGDPGNVARLMRAIDSGRFLWVGSGTNRKSLIYHGDAARACLVALTVPGGRARSTYNVSAAPCTMADIVRGLASALGRALPRYHLPASVLLGFSGSMAKAGRGRGGLGDLHATLRKWLADDVCDATRFREAFGFRADIELSEGLRREVAWYRNQPA